MFCKLITQSNTNSAQKRYGQMEIRALQIRSNINSEKMKNDLEN